MKKSFKIRITYNAPVILTFCFICTILFALDTYALKNIELIKNYFTVPGSAKCPIPFNFKSAIDYIKLFTHVLGHSSWDHLLGNISFILLLGPLLEERYGSAMIALMITVTALVTGVLNACLIPSPLLGASGIAFMLILLSSFTTLSKNEIPLSFILVFILFLCSEIFIKKNDTNISLLAHVAGGLCGSMFGFLIAPKSARTKKTKSSDKTVVADDEYASNYKPKSKYRSASEDETTVVGTIEL